MKAEILTLESRHIDELYRFTYYSGSMVMKIEVWEKYYSVFKKDKWKTIYFGHSNPISEALKFYEECRNK